MKSFKDFRTANNTMEGDKIDIEDVLNKSIIVTAYKVAPSKHYRSKGSDTYTRIQFYFEKDTSQTKRVIFTGSSVLQEQLRGIEEEEGGILPEFKTTIVKISGYYSFS